MAITRSGRYRDGMMYRAALLLLPPLLLAGCAGSGTTTDGSVSSSSAPVVAEMGAVTLFFTTSAAPAGQECDTLVPLTESASREELSGSGTSARLLGRLFAGVPAGAAPELTTAIPPGTKLLSMKTQGRTLDVDIHLGSPVGGSCRVTAIRKQILGTLNANGMYPEIRILVDGSPDGLQP